MKDPVLPRRPAKVGAPSKPRRTAEQPANDADARRLLHELEVHQIELQLQNDELLRARLELQESRDRYSTLYDHAPVGYFTLDADGKIFEANLTAAVLLGVERGLLIGAPLSSFMSEDDALVFHRHQLRVFGEDGKLGCEVRIRRRDGVSFAAHLDSVVRVSHQATRSVPALSHTVLFDLSELRSAQEALRSQESRARESESRLRQIAEHIEDVFYVREPNGVLSYISAAYERIWGRPIAELTRNPDTWLATIDGEDRERVAAAWARMRDGEPGSETYRIRRPDGSMRWVLSRWFPVLGPEREVLRQVGVVRDITTERKLEADLRKSQKMEAVAALSSGMAHNLRNVLQAVLAFIHIAQKSGTLSERASRALERAVGTAERGATLTDQLMMFSRKQETNAQPVRVDVAVHDAVELLKLLVGNQVTVELACDAPGAVILAHPMLLEQILLNLGANARDAMTGGGTLTITTDVASLDEQTARHQGVADGPHVKVLVRDTGSGMAPATIARLFEPFFTTKDIGQGTGLGLATVFALTRQAGGCIEVESTVGNGTLFILSFPMLQASA